MSTNRSSSGFANNLRHHARREASVFASSWQYFTRLPALSPAGQQAARHISLQNSARYAPLVGIIIGAVSAAIFLLINNLLHSKGLAILFSLLASILFTGAIHEDGAAHFFEAFSGRKRPKKEILSTLKSPGIATIGGLALLFGVLLKLQILLQVPSRLVPFALIAAHAFARFAALSFIYTDRRVEPDGGEDSGQPRLQPVAFLTMAAFGMLPLLLLNNLLLLLLVPILWLTRAFMGMWFVDRIGGWTADALSAVLQVIEIATYLLIAAAATYAFSI